jgi:hypothetical protein
MAGMSSPYENRHTGDDGGAHHRGCGCGCANASESAARKAEAAEHWRERYKMFATEVRNGDQARDWLLSIRSVWHEGE